MTTKQHIDKLIIEAIESGRTGSKSIIEFVQDTLRPKLVPALPPFDVEIRCRLSELTREGRIELSVAVIGSDCGRPGGFRLTQGAS